MKNDLVINQGAFNLGLQALRRAGKDEIAEQLESDCECIPDEIKRLNEKLELAKKEIRYAIDFGLGFALSNFDFMDTRNDIKKARNHLEKLIEDLER
mgnify:CR=1 FL=1